MRVLFKLRMVYYQRLKHIFTFFHGRWRCWFASISDIKHFELQLRILYLLALLHRLLRKWDEPSKIILIGMMRSWARLEMWWIYILVCYLVMCFMFRLIYNYTIIATSIIALMGCWKTVFVPIFILMTLI